MAAATTTAPAEVRVDVGEEREEAAGVGGGTIDLEPERGSFVNARGLRLQRYTWRASALMTRCFGLDGAKEPAGSSSSPHARVGEKGEETLPPAAIVIFVHGYCVHAKYEALLPAHPRAAGHTKYEGSITHRLNESGCDVHAFDLQGHGLSERLDGEPCYVADFDDFPKDVIQFTEMVKREYVAMMAAENAAQGRKFPEPSEENLPPLYILGASMGGLVTIRTAQLRPNLADGMVLLAPAIMLNDEENFCCWYYLKKPILHFMQPLLKKVRMIGRYRATDADMRYTEGADPLNFWGLMHFGMANAMMEGQLRTRHGPQIELPYLILAAPNDTHVNSMGSHDMFEQTVSKDKTLIWMNNMGHSLLYEPPGCEQVVHLAVNWIMERAKPGSVSSTELHLNERNGGYTVRRCVEQ